MKTITGSLGFRLVTASFAVIALFIFIAGVTVIKISQDAINQGLTNMAATMAKELPKDQDSAAVGDALVSVKTRKAGSAWLMDSKGFLLYHSDPRFRKEYLEAGKIFGNVIVSLQYASPRASGTGTAKEKLIDIAGKYEEGFGEYQQYGESRLLAFQVIKDKGWLVGVDEPKASANSELERIKKYIRITGVVSAILIMLFTWLAIRVIVKPYYREVEELNLRLKQTNVQLTASNHALDASNRKLTALYKISITMQETMSLEDILELIITGAQEVLGVDRINVMLPDRKGGQLVCRAAIGAGDRPLGSIAVPLTTKGGALASAFKRGLVVRTNPGEHISPAYRLAPPLADDPFLRSSQFAIVPMVVKNKAVGVIAVDNKVSRAPITEDGVNLLQIFANQAAVTVENARLYDDLKRNLEELDTRVDQLAIVNQISNTMQKMVKRREMLGFILRGIKESLGFDHVAIFVVDREEDLVRSEIGVGVDEERLANVGVPLAEVENLLASVVTLAAPAMHGATATTDFLDALTRPPAETGLREISASFTEEKKLAVGLVPVWVLDRVVGVIAAGRSRRAAVIGRKELELLMLFANTAGLAVERADLYERVQPVTETTDIMDQGTKLYTYRYGLQRTREEISRARETGKPLAVAVVGLDKFKEYNERYGQEQGDRALSDVGRLVKMVLFDNDFSFRYGGRLLGILLPGRSSAEAELAMAKLASIIRDRIFGEAREPQHLTVSIGLVEFKDHQHLEQPEELIKIAIAHLHKAEAGGGDRIFHG
jgi:diguanylate cyclase (GGDEF)-like protein